MSAEGGKEAREAAEIKCGASSARKEKAASTKRQASCAKISAAAYNNDGVALSHAWQRKRHRRGSAAALFIGASHHGGNLRFAAGVGMRAASWRRIENGGK